MNKHIFYKRTQINCIDCPLQDKKKVFATGYAKSGIAIYGEAPGADEDRIGESFVGAAGRFLNWGLGQAGIFRDNCVLSNTILCRPPLNDIGSFEAESAQTLCKDGFKLELEYLKDHGIKVIIALGKTAKDYFNIGGTITDVRGSIYKYQDIYVVPTWHPSYLMRNQWKKDRITVSMKYVWVADLKKALDLAENKIELPKEDFNIKTTYQDIENLLKSKGKLLALDVETTSLNADYGKIVVLGIGLSASKAISIPLLAQQTGLPYWPERTLKNIHKVLNELFSCSPLMFQNAAFDLKFLRKCGFDIPWKNIEHDTMILHSYISPELPHNLGFITSLYGTTPFWKDTLKTRKGSILEMPSYRLYTYNLRDVVALHQILPLMIKEAKELKVYKVYQNEGMKMLKPVMQMEAAGILLSRYKLDKWRKNLIKEIEELDINLRKLGNLPKSFNFNSDEDMRYFLFGINSAKFKKLIDLPKKKSGSIIYNQLIELKEIKDKVKPIVNLSTYHGTRTRKTRKLAVNKEGLLSIQLFLNNRLAVLDKLRTPKPEQIEAINKLQQFIGLLRRYSQLNKLISTFTQFATDNESRVHSHYSIIGTVTKRLSSSNPNLQQIPKKEINARKVFVAPKESVFLSADYSNLEVRILAYITDDKVLIDAFKRGENIHDINTKMAFNLTPEDTLWELARRAVKIFFFGGISYDGGDRTIHQKVVLEVPELNLTFAAYKQMKSNWLKMHPAYIKWKKKITQQVTKTRILRDAFGRVRVFYGDPKDIIKEGLNFPIQGTASGVINQAMIKLDNEIDKLNLDTKLIMQVHDQLVFEVPIKELIPFKPVVKKIMESPVEIDNRLIAFPIEIEVGPSLGELK